MDNASLSTFYDKIEGKEFNIQFKRNAKIIISGPSGCGKTRLLLKILENINTLFEVPPRSIYYFYQMHQDIFDDFKKRVNIPIKFIKGMPDEHLLEEIFNSAPKPSFLIYDDFGQNLNKTIAQLFAVGSHHGDLMLCLILQNLFTHSRYTRDISLSASNIIVGKNPRDSSQISSLGRQLFPGGKTQLDQIYNIATAKPYSYLMIDISQSCPDFLRLRSCILPHEAPMKCYARLTDIEKYINE